MYKPLHLRVNASKYTQFFLFKIWLYIVISLIIKWFNLILMLILDSRTSFAASLINRLARSPQIAGTVKT